jgi:maleate isomerase
MQIVDYQLIEEPQAPQLGLIVLQSDLTIEDELRYYFDNTDISLLCNRIPFENEVNAETLKQMESHLQRTTALFPIDKTFDAFGYACTSGALHIGSERIAQIVGAERSCKAVSDPMLATKTALEHLGAKRIAYLAPYSVEVCQAMIDGFAEHGINVVAAATFNESQDKLVGSIAPECIAEAAIQLCKALNPESFDAVFIACTNLKAASVIPTIEHTVGKPALSSNLALAWHLAQCAGVPLQGKRKGSLCQ